MIDDNFLENLSSDDIEAIIKLTEEFEKITVAEKNIGLFVKAYIAVKALAKNANLKIDDIIFTGSDQNNISLIQTYIRKVFDQANTIFMSRLLGNEEEKFNSLRSKIYEYEFTDNDYSTIQMLINKMRTLLQESSVVSEEHKFRLLKRLEALQSELHKKMSNLDKALGFLLDVSIIIRQTGEGAKPIAELAKEISKILTQVILVSKGLPPGEIPPLLK